MKKVILILILFIFYLEHIHAEPRVKLTEEQDVKITKLMVEYAEKPLGIDVEKPRFSWQMESPSDKRGYKQTAYQITVFDESENIVWKTDKVSSDISLNIKYDGKHIKPTTRYNWSINVWDQDNKMYSNNSWFETGLMNPDPNLSAWNGAKWIGGDDEDMVFYPSYLPVFKIDYSIQFDKKSKANKAGFIYGANDSRLMDKNKNINNIASDKDQSYILVEIDITNLGRNGGALLHVYRVGYHPDDKKDIPFKSFDIPGSLINDKNKYDTHTVYIHSLFGSTQVYIDGTEKENQVADVHLNPVGNSSDYIAFPMVADIGFSIPQKQSVTISNVEVRHYRNPSNLLYSDKPGKIEGGKNGIFQLTTPQRNAMPMLRSTFKTKESEIVKARLYVTARGIYEVYMNGKRIGDDCFNPGITQYTLTHLYQTYDVTDNIQKGENAIGALLGEGWWSGGVHYSGYLYNYFGDRQSLLAQLVVTYEDGTKDVVVTTPENWKYFNDGPIRFGSFFQGEVYDAKKESAVKGWNTTAFNDNNWQPAKEIPLKGYIATENLPGLPQVHDYSKMKLIGQFGENATKMKELTAISMDEVRPGVYVYDMGQNMVGVPKIELSGETAGKKITIRYAEVKYPDLPEYKGNIGMIMLENIRGALAQDIYFTKGGNEIINPRFTFHGYRFIEITGIDKPLPVKAVKGEVTSSIKELSSYYETSNKTVNKLWENITWSTLGNFLSIPTDCPQRNERLGWSGDISVYSRTATYMAHLPQFLRRHMLAIRDVQREDGRFADVAPLGGGFGGVLWGSAGITVPWESYLQYGDKEMLAEHYDAMKQYINYLETYIDPQTKILTEGNLGDWLGPELQKNDNTLLWEAYFIYDLEILSKIATILDKTEDAKRFEKLYRERKAFFNTTYVDPSTKKTIRSGFKQYADSKAVAGDLIDTQTSYALPLVFNIYNDKNKEEAAKNFINTVTRENTTDFANIFKGTVCPPYSLMTGFIGTAWISKALSDNGATDVAYRLLQQTSYPSWLYPVEQGATTIWERLNSYTHTNGFGGNNGMNSFNHYSFGAVGSWMYNYSLGIERDENEPGFKHFILQPEPDPTGKMTFAKGYYDSMYGQIKSGWEIKDNAVHYQLSIPANTTATLYMSAPSLESIYESGKSISKVDGIQYIGTENGKYKFKVQSGEYKIKSPVN